MLLLPYRSKNPPESLPIGTCLLIAVNIGVYALTSSGLEAHKEVVAQWGVSGRHFDLLHMFTAMFLHADPLHLLGNMWFLYLFGFAVEGRLKTIKFLVVYLLAGIAGDMMHQAIVGWQYPDMPSIGASGAIMGVLGAALFMFPFGKMRFVFGLGYYYWNSFDWPMWGVGLYYLGLDLLFGVLLKAGSGIGHFAHLGGALGGFLVTAIMWPRRDSAQASEAKALLDEVKDYSILSALELSDLAQAQPDNSLITLHWMYRSLRDYGAPKPDCLSHFMAQLPKILREQPIESVGPCIIGLNGKVAIPVQLRLDAAVRAERAGQRQMAANLFEGALADPSASDSDLETACFQLACVYERWYNDAERARGLFDQFVQRWPMSPLADQARSRLTP